MEKIVVKWHVVVICILIAAVSAYGMFLFRANVQEKRAAKETTTYSTTAPATTEEDDSDLIFEEE